MLFYKTLVLLTDLIKSCTEEVFLRIFVVYLLVYILIRRFPVTLSRIFTTSGRLSVFEFYRRISPFVSTVGSNRVSALSEG